MLGAYENWNEIDFILRQFGMRNENSWSGDHQGYVMSMIEYAELTELEELHTFLLEESESILPAQAITPSVRACWDEAPFRVFISHSSKDKENVTELKRILSYYGITCFVAHQDIHPTEEWQNEILSGLDTCHAVIAWATPNFENSFWAQQEMGMAMARRKLIVSVMNDQRPVGFVSKQQGIPGLVGDRKMVDIAKEIIRIFIQKSHHREEIQSALIQSFENAVSFADAREKMSILENFHSWNKEKLDRLQRAQEENRQVAESSGVPFRIQGMYKKYLPEPEQQEEEVSLDSLPF